MADENTNTAETAASTNALETGVTAQPKDTATSPVAANTVAQKNGADDLSEKLGMWKHQARENEQKMYENRCIQRLPTRLSTLCVGRLSRKRFPNGLTLL